MKVPFYIHNLNDSDSSQVAEVLKTPFLTSGAIGKGVEQQLCEYFQVRNSLLTNSWTNGAIATLLAMDIGPGDEVIVPAQTFIATANVVELLGATPVFVDVNPTTLLLDLEAIKGAITNKTRAVIAVHLYGELCDTPAIYSYLKSRSIRFIEDAAHCFEGEKDGVKPGMHSDAAIFSFYATKNVTCGEGGAVITNDDNLAETIRQTRLHGMSASASERFTNNKYNHWTMKRLGVKANLPDLLASLLPRQIEQIDSWLEKRTYLANRYRELLVNIPVRLQKTSGRSAEHLFPIWVQPNLRDSVIRILNDKNVQVAVNYRSVPTLDYYVEKYGYTKEDFPVSYEWGQGTLSLPFFPTMSTEQQDYVVRSLIEAINEASISEGI